MGDGGVCRQSIWDTITLSQHIRIGFRIGWRYQIGSNCAMELLVHAGHSEHWVSCHADNRYQSRILEVPQSTVFTPRDKYGRFPRLTCWLRHSARRLEPQGRAPWSCDVIGVGAAHLGLASLSIRPGVFLGGLGAASVAVSRGVVGCRADG